MTHPKPPPNALWTTDRQRPDGKGLRVRLRGAGEGTFDKKARRVVVVQCDRCLDKGSGTLNPRGTLVSVNLACEPRGNREVEILHKDCGGVFHPYDITESE